jgi:excisionase family DNA binding protein
MPKELTVVEATRRLGITIDALYRLIYAGKLPARKSDRRWLISAESVESRLKAREVRNGTSGS